MIRSDVILKVVCSSRWDTAAGVAWRATIARGVRLSVDADWFDRLVSTTNHAQSRDACVQMADDVRTQPDLAICWNLLAVDPEKPAALIDLLHDICAAVKRADPNAWPQFAPRLKALREIARGRHIGEFGSIFHIASTHWREHEIAADVEDKPRSEKWAASTPVAVRILTADSWESAHADVIAFTQSRFASVGLTIPDRLLDPTIERSASIGTGMRLMIVALVSDLFEIGERWAGDLAIAWLMLACHPALPRSIHNVLPQLQFLFDHTVIYSAHDVDVCRARLDVWWRAANGEFKSSQESMFEIASTWNHFAGNSFSGDDDETETDARAEFAAMRRASLDASRPKLPPAGPSVVVMRGDRAMKRGLPTEWREMRDREMSLVVARDVQIIQESLHLEFPHARQAIKTLTRDLREGQPVRTQPMILLGPPGGGKSRLVRRFGELLSIYVYRFDGAGASDGMFGGTPKAWSTAQPSIPARAILMSDMANPIVMVDEIEKAGTSTHNGNLWSAMTPFLERETSARYRDVGIDSELDLSHINHIATANDVTNLPGPLRDRFRIVRIPSPTLEHLPALAEQVMRDLAAEDDERTIDEPLAPDELEIIGRAWANEKFSMRKLKRLIAATLEARDHCAMRH